MTPKNIEAITRFLPVFEQDGYEFGAWDRQDDSLPWVEYSKGVHDFIKALYREGFVLSFDWAQWQNEAARLVASPVALQQANINTIQKLLTTHVRKDRFCEGHLLNMFQAGHINALLRRLSQILLEMTVDE